MLRLCIVTGIAAKEMLASVYRYYDRNSTGTITMRELRQGIEQTGQGDNLQVHMTVKNKSADGEVSVMEFISFFDFIPEDEIEGLKAWLLSKQSPAAKKLLLELFAEFDVDGNGSLSVSELEDVCTTTGPSYFGLYFDSFL